MRTGMNVDPLRLRQIAGAVLAAALLLCAVPLVAVAAGSIDEPPPATARVLPPTQPTRLSPATIVVSAQPQDSAAPATGVTGTIVLPDLPVTPAMAAAIVAGDSGVAAARPFALGRSTALDRARAIECLTAAIYYEAASEPDAGQRAVAQVILNRARHPAFPASVCGVVYQGSERTVCQFSFACDGAMARLPSRTGWTRAARTAAAALAGYVFAPVGLATHYHTYAVTPSWNRGLVMTDAVGAHFFHRWKGYWGTAAAFRQSYQGGEPVPGPHARIALPVPAPVLVAVALPAQPAGPPTDTLPAWRDGGAPNKATPPTAAAAGGEGSPDSQILPRWKDVGKPLDQ